MLDLKTQSPVIKSLVVSYPYSRFFRLKTKIACPNDKNLLCALGVRVVIFSRVDTNSVTVRQRPVSMTSLINELILLLYFARSRTQKTGFTN